MRILSMEHRVSFCFDGFSFPLTAEVAAASHLQGIGIISHLPGSLPLALTSSSGMELVPEDAGEEETVPSPP